MKLKELRKKQGLTQHELGKILNIHRTSINNYEHNYSAPSIETLIQFADYFNVSLDYLVERKSKPYEIGNLTIAQTEMLDIIKDLNDKEISNLKGYITAMKKFSKD